MGKDISGSYFWLISIVALLAGAMMGMTFFPSEKIVELPGEEIIIEIEVPGETVIEYVNVSVPVDSNSEIVTTSEEDWVAIAWNQILEEFDNDEEFLTCGEHEFDDDELDKDLEEASISWDEDGNYEVALTYQFDWEDNSDERDCKIDHSFTVYWDDNDVEDQDWDEAEVEMLS